MKLIDKIFSVIFPHKCTFCRKAISYKNAQFICPDCMESLPFIKGSSCARCSSPRQDGSMPICQVCRKFNHPYSGSFTPLLYEGKVRKALINYKFYNRENFSRSFGFLIADNIVRKDFPDIDFITFVPLSSDSLKERGFNQSQLIAEKCGELLNVPVKATLKRINGTPKQSTLSDTERRKNAKKAFYATDQRLSGTALLIDDIYTTGSTMSHCASLLLKMGCSRVYIASVALRSKN